MTALDDIRQAREIIAGRVHRTPLVHSRLLGERTGLRLFFKAENLQKTGSFKPRGVFNKLHALSGEEKQRGLITVSAGNHAQALAYAAAAEGLQCVVVMPAHASPTKAAASRSYGAEVIMGGTMHEAFDKMQELREARGLTLVHPYDDAAVIAGQGTVGLEILEDLPELEAVVVPIGGGGLISGIAAAIRPARPTARIIGVEPHGAPTMATARERNTPTRLDSLDTIADGLTAPVAGALTFAAVQRLVDEVVLVSDEEIVDAVTATLQYTKLLAEPAGAAGLAALLSGRVRLPAGTRTVVVLSGGNVDAAVLKKLL